MGIKSGRFRRFIAGGATIAVLVTGGLVATATAASADGLSSSPAPVLERGSDHVTSDNLPTVQINDGYVWAQTTIGTTVYAVGSFSNVRPAGAAVGTNLTPRSNVLAYDITTGNLVTGFAPTVNGVVKAVAASPDGKSIYIGGSFNTVDGQTRYNFAVLDAATGALVPGVSPSVGGSGVYAITATSSAVYLGGLFTQANGVARKNLTAFNPSNGALLPWAPTTDLQVDAMVMEPQTGNVVIGGRFYAVNSQVQRGLADLDPVTGAINTGWQAPNTVKNGWSSGSTAGKAGIFGLATDSSGVYGTGWGFASLQEGNLEGVFAANAGSGSIRWISDCHGDHYGIYSTGSVVYATDHTHQCDTVNLWPDANPRTYRYTESYTTYANGTLTRSPSAGSTYADWSGTPSPSAYDWFPDFTVGTTSGLGQAGLSITGAGGYISVGGEFGSVNNKSVQGLTRFSTTPSGGAKQGPRISTANWQPSARSLTAGTVYVSTPQNWDRDDLTLNYALKRAGTSKAVATVSADSTWWKLGTEKLVDTTAPPGSSQTYTVTATDPDGNSVTSSPVTVTVASGNTAPYANAVLSDSPSLYYRLGGDRTDWAGTNNPVYGSDVSTATPGGISEADSAASVFTGSSDSYVSSPNMAAPDQYSVELWFKTSSTAGGKLIGYGSSQTGLSGNYDRHVYMQNNGQLVYGNYPGGVRTVTSPNSYNDGRWHYAAASQGSDGMKLYVDGALVASDSSTTTAQAYSGYWRIAGDNVNGWPNQPSSSSFAGSMDDVAVYPNVLTQAQVSAHYSIGKGLTPPTASFTSSSTGLTANFDASATTVSSGQIVAGYAWDFGDGATASGGPTMSHSYTAAGTYPVTLTVTDTAGLTNSSTKQVTVRAPNVAPAAAFTSTTSGLAASVDATGSSDADGSVVGYSWEWGDGSADGSGATTAHAYAQPGTYTIKLTVTDNDGATGTKSGTVTVTHAAPTAAFSAVPDGLSVAVDGTSSTAADGATLAYDWSWGDGTADGDGATTHHSYAAAGKYTVTLKTTDSLGKSDTTTESVTVSAVTYAASDSFSRTTASGWGAADIGGTWSALYGAASAGSVNGSTGDIALAPGGTRNMALQGVSLQDSRSAAQFSLSAAASTGNSYVGIASRQSSSTNYTVRAYMRSDGTVWLIAQAGSTMLKSVTVSGLTWSPSDTLNLVTEVTGTSPTTIEGKIWKVGSTEPSSWTLSTTDSTSGLQTAGYTSLHFARAAAATASSTVSFDDVTVVDTSSAPPANTAPTASFSSSTAGLKTSVDGSGSSDAEGAIASYSWDWGDGSAAGSGATASHTYSAAGSYSVKLTVTDAGGLADTQTKTVTVTAAPPANTAPTASFSSSTAGLKASVDGSGSSDAEGAIASYSWDWGDGSAAGSGATASHTYSAAGSYSVKLTVTDAGGLADTQTKTVTVTAAPPANTAPTASFSSSTAGLKTSVDGSGSSDAEGAIASYSWDWGDGSAAGSGATASHTYSAAGSYSVKLTVTDAGGLADTQTKTVTVTAALDLSSFVAADDFGRAVTTSSWGTADKGGTWTTTGGSATATVINAAGQGQVTTAVGGTRYVTLQTVSTQNVQMQADISLDQAASTGSSYVGFVARQIGSDNYQVRAWMRPDGSVWLVTQHGSTVLGTYAVPGISRAAGDTCTLKVQVTGSGTTSIRAKLYKAGSTEPTNWQITSTDTTAALQAPGAVGVLAARSSSATSTAVTAFDTFRVSSVD